VLFITSSVIAGAGCFLC